MSWPEQAIEEFCSTGSGTTPSRKRAEFFGGKIPWVKSGELNGGLVSSTEETVTPLAVEQTSLKHVPAGALLIAMYGANVGHIAELGVDATTNQAVCHIVPNPEVADRRYLFRFLQFKAKYFVDRGVGGAQSNISQGIIKETMVPLPPLEEQKRIAAILDQADALRRLRQRTINHLDTLAKSIFLSHQRELNSPTRPLIEYCEKITDGTHQSPKWTEDGVPFLFVSNIRNQKISFETEKFISDETYDELTRNTKVDAGDVLYTSVGSYGHAATVPTGKKFLFQRHIAHLKPKRGKLLPTYLMHLLESPNVKAQADRTATGIAQKTVTLGALKAFQVKVPDFDSQGKVLKKLDGVSRLLSESEHYSAKAETAFASLQQRAFRGEL